jgi:hypothetical protein
MENNKSKNWVLRWQRRWDRDPQNPVLNPDRDWIFLLGGWFVLVALVGGGIALGFLRLTAFTQSVPAEIASSTGVTLNPLQVNRATTLITERAAHFSALRAGTLTAIDPSH